MPFAIDRDCVAAIYPGTTDASTIVLVTLSETGEHTVEWADALKPGKGASRGSWMSYVLGVIAEVGAFGSVDSLRGSRIVVATDVPLGAGVSSSAALEVSVGIAVAAHCGINLGGLDLAKACQAAEHRFAGVPCGLMDQAISVLGREGHALMLDCATEETTLVPTPSSCELILVNSGVKHALADGEYAKRREVCEHAAELLGVPHLAHANTGSLDVLSPDVLPFARHVVSETTRVRQLSDQLASGNIEACGQVMLASHASLRDDFLVSCPEIDTIVDALDATPGVYGARMTGGGFGGSVIALTQPGQIQAIDAALEPCRAVCPNLEVLPVRASDGASLMNVMERR